MYRWSWCIAILLSLLCYACNNQSDPSAVETPAVEATESPDPESTIPKNEATATPTQTPTETGIALPVVNPLEVEGDIAVAGSSTVFPLTLALYERFIDEGYAGIVKVDSVGTGGGFKLFCQDGATDISNASRQIKEKERQACRDRDRTPIEFRVGTDALAVAVNPKNKFLKDARLKELAAIFTAENWSDVNPDWPEEPIQRFVPDTDSGTFDFFVEAVFDGDIQTMLDAPNTEFSADDDTLVQAIAADPYAIGFFGYAYYQQNVETLNVLAVEGIAPNTTTVENGKYPLARPLFIYSDSTTIREKPQVGAFINFYLTHVNEEIERVGYFPASRIALDGAKLKLLQTARN